MKIQPVTMGVFHGGQLEQEMMKPFILMIQVCFEQIDNRDVTWKSYRNRVFFSKSTRLLSYADKELTN